LAYLIPREDDAAYHAGMPSFGRQPCVTFGQRRFSGETGTADLCWGEERECLYIKTDIGWWSVKGLEFAGESLMILRELPRPIKRLVGYELGQVQRGLEPSDWKPMITIGPGVRELRVRAENAWRVFYVATFPEAVYVLHIFRKKTRKTSFRDIHLGRQRYKSLLLKREREQ
jgi:phage-related protein